MSGILYVVAVVVSNDVGDTWVCEVVVLDHLVDWSFFPASSTSVVLCIVNSFPTRVEEETQFAIYFVQKGSGLAVEKQHFSSCCDRDVSC